METLQNEINEKLEIAINQFGCEVSDFDETLGLEFQLIQVCDKIKEIEEMLKEDQPKEGIFHWAFEDNGFESPSTYAWLMINGKNIDIEHEGQSIPEMRRLANSICKEHGVKLVNSSTNNPGAYNAVVLRNSKLN